MRQSLLIALALLMVISSASAIAPRKRFAKRYSGAGMTRSLLRHSNRYLTDVRAQWMNQPVRVGSGYKRYSPFTVLGTSATVEKSGSMTSPFIGYLNIKVRYRETALCANPQKATSAAFRGYKEFVLQPSFAFRQGKWVPATEE